MQNPKPGEVYRHFKGNLYKVLLVAEHTETGEQMIVYQSPSGSGKIYARPLEMFRSKVDRTRYPDAEQKYRFELVREESAVPASMDPLVDQFLETSSPSERLSILSQLEPRATDEMIAVMSVAVDFEPVGETTAEKLQALRQCLRLHERYEKGERLR